MPQLATNKVAHRGDPFSCLVIGPTGSGKSCLLKSINVALESLRETPDANLRAQAKEKLFSTVCPTVGTEMINMQLPARALLSSPWSSRITRTKELNSTQGTKVAETVNITLREVGGSLQPLWSRYFADANAICIVIDGSCLLSPCGGSALSFVTIADVLANEQTGNLPIAVLISKVDGQDEPSQRAQDSLVPTAVDIAGIAGMLFSIDQLFQARSQQVSVSICTSAKTDAGVVDFARWLAYLATSSPV